MSKKKISFGVLFGGISLAANSLSGLIIYPLLIKNLSKEVAGLWFFYTSLSVIISLGQAGLTPIVMRHAAMVKIDGNGNVLADYYALINKSFRIVSLFVLAICIILYFSYVHWVLLENPTLFKEGLIAWIFFVAGNIININFSKNFNIIDGFGEVGWEKINQIVIVTFTIIGYFVALRLGAGLIGLSIVFFTSSIIYAITSKILLKKFVPNEMFTLKGTFSRDQIISLFKEGGQILVLNIVGILVMNKDFLLVERFLGLSVLPLFSVLIRVQGIVIAVSLMVPQMISPFISQSFSQCDYKKTYKLYWQGVILSVIISIILSAIILISANTVFELWLGPGNYLGNSIMFLLFIMGILYIHHCAHASAVISTGKNSFMWPSIINGILSVLFAIIGIKYFGIPGMIIGNLIATLLPSVYVVNFSVRYFNSLNNKK